MDQYRDYKIDRRLGFRVEVHDTQHRNPNSTFRTGDWSMTPRDSARVIDDGAFLDHFDWNPLRGGPFISFFNSWNQAMKRRQMFICQGAQHVVVLAVWLEGLEVYDAYRLACDLGVDRPEQHLDEYLLHGGVWADSYRILGSYDGDRELEDVSLSLTVRNIKVVCEVKIPRGFARSTATSQICMRTLIDATEDFKKEMYSCSGVLDGVKLDALLRSITGVNEVLLLAGFERSR